MTDPVLIQENPNKNWSLQVYTDDKGVERVRTGYYNAHRSLQAYREVPNRIIRTGVKVAGFGRGRSAVKFSMVDRSGFKYIAGGKTTMLLLGALSSGVIRIMPDGYLEGLWTFAKQGSEVYIAPVDPATMKVYALPEDPEAD